MIIKLLWSFIAFSQASTKTIFRQLIGKIGLILQVRLTFIVGFINIKNTNNR